MSDTIQHQKITNFFTKQVQEGPALDPTAGSGSEVSEWSQPDEDSES